MSLAVVTLKKGEGRTLKAGGAWVFDNEIANILGSYENGDIVLVHDFDGYPMGRGFINEHSKIRIRMMTRHQDQEIDEAFLRMRVKDAWEYRKKTVDTSSCRLIFGEADFLPGFVVDKFSDVIVVQSLALGIDRMKENLVRLIKEVLAEDGVIIRGVYERSDAKEREKEGMEKRKGFIGPEFDTEVEIVENGVRYEVDVKDGQKTGFFLDQKYKGDIYLYDSERDSFMMALKSLGYSMNTSDQGEIDKAYQWLLKCVGTMKPEIVTDEIIDNMAQARKALGLIYSGDATYVMAENPKMGYYLPDSGTNQWSDAMVIPKNAKNVDLAYAFINYASDYDGAYDNSSYVGYTSANKKVMEDLYGKGGEFEGIDAYIPRTDNKKDEVFEYNEKTKKIISNLWSKVKIAASNK